MSEDLDASLAGQWQCLRRVEARSTGQIDFAFSATHRPRELAVLRPHENGKDWRAQPSRLHHGAWHKSLEDAISYAAFRLRGHLSEIRILNRYDEVDGVVLIDQTGAEPSANGPALWLTIRTKMEDPNRGAPSKKAAAFQQRRGPTVQEVTIRTPCRQRSEQHPCGLRGIAKERTAARRKNDKSSEEGTHISSDYA